MGISNKHIFILGLSRFDGGIESTSFVFARHLAKNNFVYYIDNPYTLVDYFRFRNTSQFLVRKNGFSNVHAALLDTHEANLKILITPVVPSIHFLPEGNIYRRSLRINEHIIRKRIKEVIEKLGIEEFIYINSFNFHYPNLMKGMDPALTVYQCLDPMIMPFDKKHGVISENILVKESQMVVCSAKELYREKVKQNNNTHYIPNAADITHSSKALLPETEVNYRLKEIPRPIIGYFGAIERRIDYDLIRQVAEDNKDKSFVFCGPHDSLYMPEWMTSTPNIYLTGSIPYTEMPSILKGFDIAMIPFKKDKVSATIFPLKLFEYLGAGNPVIATDFNPDLAELTDKTVRYVADAASFTKQANEILKENSPEAVEKRVKVATNNTWDKRVEGFSRLLNENL